MFESVAVALMAIWLLLTVLRQVVDRPSWWRWDVFCLIPRWTFFSPNPIRCDFVLMTRSRDRDQAPDTPWQPSPFLRKRALSELLLNPAGRCNRVVYQLTLAALREHRSSGSVAVDSPVQRALGLVVRGLCNSGAERVPEAVVVQSFGFVTDQPPRVVMAWQPEPSES